jgi:tetratricopeptide (TPR) repeat protein
MGRGDNVVRRALAVEKCFLGGYGLGMGSSAIPREMGAAIEHHRAGRFREAEVIYRRVLAEEPNHADAMQLLGAVAGQTGRVDLAIELIQKAIVLNPKIAAYQNNLAKILCDQGRFEEAIAACKAAIGLDPKLAEAQNNLGNAFLASGKHVEAIAAYRAAIAIRPDYFDAMRNLGVVLGRIGDCEGAVAVYRRMGELRPGEADVQNNLGNVLVRLDRIDEAIGAYGKALGIQPGHFQAYNNIADAFRLAGRLDESIAASRQAIAIRPDFAEAFNALGLALTTAKRLDEAIAALGRAVEIKPEFMGAHNNLGAALYQSRRMDEAIGSYRRALELDAGHPEVLSNLGLALCASGKNEEAMAAYREALRLQSGYAEAHYYLGISLLLEGELDKGWRENEWRWLIKDARSRPRKCSQPMWGGEDLGGRTILLDAEQGFGDVIQFVRYVPEVAKRGGRVILMCYGDLVRLVRGVEGLTQICSRNPPPTFDVHCPLVSLPGVIGTGLDSIPAEIPYLKADDAIVAGWGKKMGSRGDRMRVGLVWAGEPSHNRDMERSISLSQFGALTELGDIEFYSLQKGEAAVQAQQPPAGMKLVDFSADIRDFADTAGLISQLDLVVTVDTAVAHLAGAMGKRVWVLLAKLPDWRWMLDREDSPWYPTMRLFRQKTMGDWDEVIRRIAKELAEIS